MQPGHWRTARRGELQTIHVVLIVAGVLLVLGILVMSTRSAMKTGVEDQLPTKFICAACNEVSELPLAKVMQGMMDAQARGDKNIATGPNAPVGYCPECGKPALYYATLDESTGQIVLPPEARSQPTAQ